MIDLLSRQIGTLDRARARLIAEEPGLSRPAARLAVVPGIAPTVSVTLLGELPELGSLGR